MHFMNEWDVQEAAYRFNHHPTLGPATKTLVNLMNAVNGCSDGWAYWGKPVRAADKLMTLIEGDRSYESRHSGRTDVTAAQVKAAYTPIKSFLTRHAFVGSAGDILVEP